MYKVPAPLQKREVLPVATNRYPYRIWVRSKIEDFCKRQGSINDGEFVRLNSPHGDLAYKDFSVLWRFICITMLSAFLSLIRIKFTDLIAKSCLYTYHTSIGNLILPVELIGSAINFKHTMFRVTPHQAKHHSIETEAQVGDCLCSQGIGPA